MKSKSHKLSALKFVGKSVDIKELSELIRENLKLFKDTEFYPLLEKFYWQLESSAKLSIELEVAAQENDFDKNVAGNGYWSFIHNYNAAIKVVSKICKQLRKNRDKLLFNKKFYVKELELWSEIFEGLNKICETLLALRSKNVNKRCLYARDDNWKTLYELSMSINQRAFYGNAVGFQCYDSVKPIVNLMVTSLVSYSKFHHSDKHKSIRLLDFSLSTGKYFLKREKRAHKFISASHKSDVELCKNFWCMTESKALSAVPNAIGDKVEVNKIFKIPPQELKIFSMKYRRDVDIPIPHSHIGTKPVSCRLMSAHRRQGMKNSTKSSKQMSRNLLFHVHGGGWAAQTSKSHEIYLKQWAVTINSPILSIDYSLAPQAPFPRALEEIFYAYCWALENFHSLGTTGERIVLAGDSAGSNLISSLMVKLIEEGIKLPHGIVNIYGIFNIDFMISPSAAIALIDPILPFGITTNLIKSYAMDTKASMGLDSNENIIIEHTAKTDIPDKFNFVFQKSNYLSPYQAPDAVLREFPPTRFVSTILDPLCDDSIEFGKKLRALDVDVEINMLQGLYHGFLYFIQLSKECRRASLLCAHKINEFFKH